MLNLLQSLFCLGVQEAHELLEGELRSREVFSLPAEVLVQVRLSVVHLDVLESLHDDEAVVGFLDFNHHHAESLSSFSEADHVAWDVLEVQHVSADGEHRVHFLLAFAAVVLQRDLGDELLVALGWDQVEHLWDLQ